MEIFLGERGLEKSHQDPFSPTVSCDCGGEARIMFVAFEDSADEKNVCDLRPNGGQGDYWPHDCIAVAVYLCKDCFAAIARINQA